MFYASTELFNTVKYSLWDHSGFFTNQITYRIHQII